MPDDRLFHVRLLQSEKVDSLTDFERNVWWVCRLACDDFGVMRFSANTLQEAARFLENRPRKVLERAFERVRAVDLVRTFDHEGRTYCYQWDWQDWQKVDYPRSTLNPKPPTEAIDACTVATRQLFDLHPGGWRGRKKPNPPNNSAIPSEVPPKVSEIPTPKPLAVSRKPLAVSRERDGASPSADDVLSERAARFLERYQELYIKHRHGAHYLVRPHLDFPKAKELCGVWNDERLDKMASIFLLTDHKFAEEGSRTIGQFAALASWCDGRLAEAGIA